MSKEKKKQQLGKGIRALLANMETEEPMDEKHSVVSQITRSVAQVPLSWIEINPHQPRQEFDEEALNNLAQSIKSLGIIQPLTLRRLSEEEYQLISGERRLRAAKLAGLESVPAYIRLADDQGMLEMALVENIQREDLNALEVAMSMNRLIAECELTHEQLSERIGKDRSTVTNYLRLLKLPPEIQRAVSTKRLSMGHARALAGIADLSTQLVIFKEAIDKGLNVRELEKLIRAYQHPEKRPSHSATQINPEEKAIQDELSAVFGSRVSLKRNARGAGTVTIHFRSDDDLNRILDLLQDE